MTTKHEPREPLKILPGGLYNCLIVNGKRRPSDPRWAEFWRERLRERGVQMKLPGIGDAEAGK